MWNYIKQINLIHKLSCRNNRYEYNRKTYIQTAFRQSIFLLIKFCHVVSLHISVATLPFVDVCMTKSQNSRFTSLAINKAFSHIPWSYSDEEVTKLICISLKIFRIRKVKNKFCECFQQRLCSQKVSNLRLKLSFSSWLISYMISFPVPTFTAWFCGPSAFTKL